jgi:DNA-binding beta-propeller fold protein YncE
LVDANDIQGEVIMATVLGQKSFRYEVEMNWGKLPDGWDMRDASAVATDKQDRVYVFNRGTHCTDDGDHTVRKFTPEGKLLLEIGVPGKPAPFMSGDPFHRCTHTALSPSGEIYVADGYGNARVHKYSPDGKRLLSWGEPGCSPGEFNIVHNICCDAEGWVYVADRENHRVQVFDRNGKYETQWTNVHRPCALWMEPHRHPLCYVGELGPVIPISRKIPNLGPRISVMTHKGEVLARVGELGDGLGPDQFVAPHGLAIDSHGDIYVGEVSYTAWPSMYPDKQPPAGLRTLRKLVRINA